MYPALILLRTFFLFGRRHVNIINEIVLITQKVSMDGMRVSPKSIEDADEDAEAIDRKYPHRINDGEPIPMV